MCGLLSNISKNNKKQDVSLASIYKWCEKVNIYLKMSFDNHHMLIYNIQNQRERVIFMAVGANIRRRRAELRMSQQELADAMGYKTRSTIAKIESGENDVSQRKLQLFAQALDTTVEALIFGYTTAAVTSEYMPLSEDKTRNRNIVVILAGGKTGKNMQSIPTQFINVRGKPILMYSMEVYQNHSSIDEIYVVCVRGWERIVKDCAKQYGVTKLRAVIPAGNSGTGSLKNAVEHIRRTHAPDDLILIQEATRPMVTAETVSKLLHACAERDSATICHAMKDYVQFQIDGNSAEYVDRNTLVALQSPEAHRLSLLCELFDTAQRQRYALTESCCTMLLYHMGYEIHFVESHINNIKLIREEDISVFQALV